MRVREVGRSVVSGETVTLRSMVVGPDRERGGSAVTEERRRPRSRSEGG